jgi:hypothetical protein
VSNHRRLTRAPLTLLLALLLVVSLLPASAGAVPGSYDAAGDRIPDQILVKFKDGAPGRAVAEARRAAGAEERSTIEQLGVHVWRVPEHASARALRGLQRNPHVEYAEHDAIVELEEIVPDDPWWRYQASLVRARVPEAWGLATGDRGTRIAILDTGVAAVPDLMHKLVPGWNTVSGSRDTSDHHGHGTRSASVAAADTDNGLGIAGYCWDCSIMPVKVLDGSSGSTADVAAGIVWATDAGADVVSMSLSGPSSSTTLLDAVRYAHGRDVVMVAAAGNNGDSVQRFPAAYSEVIGVAGSDLNDARYSWSNHGGWVDVSAPGINYSAGRDGTFGTYAGTSSATPAVAGVLGLARSTGATAAEARSALQQGALPLSFVKYGRIDARATLELLPTPSTPAVEDPDPAPSPTPEPTPQPEPEPEPAPPSSDPAIALSVSTNKARGIASATLLWSGAKGSMVDVHIDGRRSTVSNTGTYTHETGQRGNPSITYQVCDVDGCSRPVTVTSW